MTTSSIFKRFFFISLIALLFSTGVHAQKRAAIKTNTLYWATLSPNIGGEIVLRDNFTFELAASFNPFTFGERQWQHVMATAEFRYWVFEPFSSHFFGLHYVVGTYNVGGFSLPFNTFDGLSTRRARGNANGVGLTYGHNWIIGNRLALEALIGVGYARFNYDTYPLGSNGTSFGSNSRNYFGPTRIGLSLVRVF